MDNNLKIECLEELIKDIDEAILGILIGARNSGAINDDFVNSYQFGTIKDILNARSILEEKHIKLCEDKCDLNENY